MCFFFFVGLMYVLFALGGFGWFVFGVVFCREKEYVIYEER